MANLGTAKNTKKYQILDPSNHPNIARSLHIKNDKRIQQKKNSYKNFIFHIIDHKAE
jgi:hypothetical protein